jgi:GT2 family glycosyltransferase
LSCCLIAREVFEAVERPWFQFRVRADGHQTGEDVFFCERAAKAGFKPLAHPGVLCSHRRRVDLRSIRNQLESASSACSER